MYQSGVSVNVCINQQYHLIDTYTMTDTPDWYIHYDYYIHYHWYICLIYTLRLIHLIETYTMIDTADWYIHWLINQSEYITHSVCINHSGCFTLCMYQSGVSIIAYVSPRWINHSVCINHSTLSLIHLFDIYTKINPPDWNIHYDWYCWLIHTLTDTPDWYICYGLIPLIDTYTEWNIHYE
jgi:hypothetical protein